MKAEIAVTPNFLQVPFVTIAVVLTAQKSDKHLSADQLHSPLADQPLLGHFSNMHTSKYIHLRATID